MALKKCRECGKEVSTNANKCPHCGAPLPTFSNSQRGIYIIFWAIIAIIALYALFESGILDDVFNRSSTTTYTIRPIQHESLDDSDLDDLFEN